MLISIIVPCYNEEEALPHFKARFDEVAATIAEATFELLFVDDGSSDATLSVLDGFVKADSRVRVLSFSRNFGKEAALLAGLEASTGDLVAVMDADLQDPPELLRTMLDMMAEDGCDCVAAKRVTRAGEPPVRSLFARLFYWMIGFMSPVRIEDGARDFRLMRREMVDAILRLTERRRFSKGLFAWVGFDVCYVSYENVERVAGVPKWSFWGLLIYALEGFFSQSTLPLSLPFILGFFTLLAAIVLLCVGHAAAAGMCLAAMIVLTCLGVLGQYLARVYWEAKKRPLYLLKKDRAQ